MWSSDPTYLPMAQGFLYLMAILDIASRNACRTRWNALLPRGARGGLSKFEPPEIFNTNQGSQFTQFTSDSARR